MKIICLTPVKNEEWILARFLGCASKWADQIIVADQNSTDNSVGIASTFNKVRVIRNDSTSFNEPDRQKMLIKEARKISGDRLLIALDADEFLSANFANSSEWKRLQNLPRGTRLYLETLNLSGNKCEYWSKGYHYFGYVDDGEEHCGIEIDSPRFPTSGSGPEYRLNELKVLHFQYTDTERAKFKQIWYQCLEKTLSDVTYIGGRKTNFYIFERYNKYRFRPKNILPLNENWYAGYLEDGIDLFSHRPSTLPHQIYIRELFDLYGVEMFNKLDIWDVDWNELFGSKDYPDPRSKTTKIIHRWLNRRERLRLSRPEEFILRLVELLNLF